MADRLEARGWRGHCFVSTDAIGTRGFLTAAQIRELDARGHIIGTPLRLASGAVQRLRVGQMRDEWSRSRHAARGPPRSRGRVGIGSGRLLLAARRSDGARRGTAGALHLGADDDRARRRRLLRRRPLHAPARHAPDAAAGSLQPAPWTRYREWASWNAKGLVKPLLGPRIRARGRLVPARPEHVRGAAQTSHWRASTARNMPLMQSVQARSSALRGAHPVEASGSRSAQRPAGRAAASTHATEPRRHRPNFRECR